MTRLKSLIGFEWLSQSFVVLLFIADNEEHIKTVQRKETEMKILHGKTTGDKSEVCVMCGWMNESCYDTLTLFTYFILELFYSILSYPILYSALSILFYSTLFYSILF